MGPVSIVNKIVRKRLFSRESKSDRILIGITNNPTETGTKFNIVSTEESYGTSCISVNEEVDFFMIGSSLTCKYSIYCL